MAEAILKLSLGFDAMLAHNCFGKRFPIKISTVDCDLLLPEVEWTAQTPYLKAPAELRSEIRNSWFYSETEKLSEWGSPLTWNKSKEVISYVRQVSVVVKNFDAIDILYGYSQSDKGMPKGIEVEQLIEGAAQWLRHFQLWTGILTKQYSDPSRPYSNVEVLNPGIVVHVFDGALSGARSSNQVTVKSADPNHAITEELLTDLCARASNFEKPPIESEFLASARMALMRKEIGRGLIEAGTAAELALNRILVNELSVSSAIRSERRTLGGLIQLISKYRTLPEDNKLLLDYRNGVVHRGVAPNIHEAWKAFACAEKIVSMVQLKP